MARRSPINLLRNDFEEAAEYVKRALMDIVPTSEDFTPAVWVRLQCYCLVHALTLSEANEELWKYRLWVDRKLHEWKMRHYNDRWYGMDRADLVAFNEELVRESALVGCAPQQGT